MTKSLLKDFAKELTLAVASTFQQLAGVNMNTQVLESAIDKIAERVTDQMLLRARALAEAHQEQPAPSQQTITQLPKDVTLPHGPPGKGAEY